MVKLIELHFNDYHHIQATLNISNVTLPCVVGCSIIDIEGREYDIQHHQIQQQGVFNFQIDLNINFLKNQNIKVRRIIFALWQDDSFTQRICDTGWIDMVINEL